MACRHPALLVLLGVSWAAQATAQDCESVPVAAPLPCSANHVRFDAATSTIFVRGAVACTLVEVAAAVPEPALMRVRNAPGTWLLAANLILQEGARLMVYGPAAGGPVEELRLRSVAATGGVVNITANWGHIDLRGTRVTSWDESAGAPMREPSAFGRAFLRALSFMDGTTPRQSRMDIQDSELAYLGYDAPESYGLVWKVEGTGDSGVDSPLFGQLEVSGSLVGSHVHHNFMGLYTWGASCMAITDNHVHDNVSYGLDPHDNSDHLLVSGNHVHHNGRHGFICSKNCDHLSVLNNVVHDNALHGIMLHRLDTDSVIQGNIVFNNTIGIAIYDSHDNVIRDNLVMDNQFGIQVYVGSQRNLLLHNQVTGNTRVGVFFTVTPNDVPTSGDPHPRDNQVRGNLLSGNADPGTTAGDAPLQLWEDNQVLPLAPGYRVLTQAPHPAQAFSGSAVRP